MRRSRERNVAVSRARRDVGYGVRRVGYVHDIGPTLLPYFIGRDPIRRLRGKEIRLLRVKNNGRQHLEDEPGGCGRGTGSCPSPTSQKPEVPFSCTFDTCHRVHDMWTIMIFPNKISAPRNSRVFNRRRRTNYPADKTEKSS
ncbi:Hypothetical protein NTJ_12479 [Nesidiocoris tenuis]|uniref:Uncharacterized protein n=1 Tax=Nesidiocoris tenuis TaxID=355587 RepID=A0ABN7B7M7_9HEMI|nr:Hypothetical protein NTJ_12479 [Nesidiocoris tenuis]